MIAAVGGLSTWSIPLLACSRGVPRRSCLPLFPAAFPRPTRSPGAYLVRRMTAPDTIERFVDETVASLANGTFVRLLLVLPAVTGDAPRKILGRCILLKGAPHLSLTFRHTTRDMTKNRPVAEATDWVREQLRQPFRSALLGTTRVDWQLIPTASGSPRLVSHKPTRKQAPPRAHDQQRKGLLDATARDWLHGLGILDRDGKLRASRGDKHRQINHYLTLLAHLARECGWIKEHAEPQTAPREDRRPSPPSDAGPPLTLADMGCGKGYLTFGAWHLFRRVWQQPVRVIGVEARPELVAAANLVARQVQADGLEFIAGDIASAPLPPVDALIALHACNTATDDALRRGIELGAKLIVVAPCCHQELRPQLARPAPLAPVLRHGIMAERLAEWVTDGLRALFLEWAGYRTKLMEFVASEHTPKNLMLAALREREPFVQTEARESIEVLKAWFGIRHQALDELLKQEPVQPRSRGETKQEAADPSGSPSRRKRIDE